jgi:hypothetical protein
VTPGNSGDAEVAETLLADILHSEAKDSFTIDLEGQTVTCPGIVAGIRAHGGRHAGTAEFGAACADCRLRDGCTTAKAGRTVSISPYEVRLAAGRARQADYRATRPKVERKIGHLMRRRHGGRRARVRGRVKVAADFSLLAAAVNLARLGRLGVVCRAGTWTTATA